MMDDDTKMIDLRRSLLHVLRLAEVDAPESIKAHYLVGVLLPRLTRIIGVKHVAKELATLMGKGMAAHIGYCVVCQKADATIDDECDACHTTQAEFNLKMEADFPARDDMPLEFRQFVARQAAKRGIEATPDEVATVAARLNRIVRERAAIIGIRVPESEMELTGWIAKLVRGGGGL